MTPGGPPAPALPLDRLLPLLLPRPWPLLLPWPLPVPLPLPRSRPGDKCISPALPCAGWDALPPDLANLFEKATNMRRSTMVAVLLAHRGAALQQLREDPWRELMMRPGFTYE